VQAVGAACHCCRIVDIEERDESVPMAVALEERADLQRQRCVGPRA
jgi:hypothetical protein